LPDAVVADDEKNDFAFYIKAALSSVLVLDLIRN